MEDFTTKTQRTQNKKNTKEDKLRLRRRFLIPLFISEANLWRGVSALLTGCGLLLIPLCVCAGITFSEDARGLIEKTIKLLRMAHTQI